MNGEYRIGDIVMQNWVIRKKLGEGSFGKVFRIEREDFGEVYHAALKIITVPQSDGELQAVQEEGMGEKEAEAYFYGMVEDIVREFALMAKLKGTAHVVSYEDHEVVRHGRGIGWDILIRMEELTPLLTYAYAHPFARRDIIRLGIHICSSLELCQRYNIIHRDIKPENIFVSENGDFKLGDFGIARTVEKTMSGLSKKGTYNYMAPEVYKGLDYGFSVDIYSLGLVLYRLLNRNRVPFLPPAPKPLTYSSREQALARRMRGEEIPAPYYGTGRLWEIVRKAVAYRPDHRYTSPGGMRQELEAILYSEEDASFIYPEGDEVVLKENVYASSGGDRTVRRQAHAQKEDFERDSREDGIDTVGIWVGKEGGRNGKKEDAGEGGSAGAGDWPGDENRVSVSGTDSTVSVFGAGKEDDYVVEKGGSGKKKLGKRKGLRIGLGVGAAAAVVLVAAIALNHMPDSGKIEEGRNAEADGESGSGGEDGQAAPTRQELEEEYKALQSQAQQLYESDPAQAMELMDQALALLPDEPYALTDYAYALYRTGDYDGCISYGENDLELGKAFEPSLQSQLDEILGAAYFEKGDYAGAASYFRLSAAGSEMRESAMRDYAVCLARLGSVGEAGDVLAKLRTQGANSDVTRYVEGEVAYASGDYAEGEKLFGEILENADDLSIKQRAFRSLAGLYRECASLEMLGDSPIEDAAVKEAKLLLTGIGEYGLSYDSALYEMLGKAAYEASVLAASKEIDLGSDYRIVAIDAFERVLELGMKKEYIYGNLYSIHYEMGNHEAAEEVLTRMETAFPKSYVPHALRGVLLITVENAKPEAERDYSGAEAEYEAAGNLLSGTEDEAYYEQLGGLISRLREQGWL